LQHASRQCQPRCICPDTRGFRVRGGLLFAGSRGAPIAPSTPLRRTVRASPIRPRSPEGKQLAYVSTGKELPTNVAFGYGDDANLLYVTSGKSLYTIRMVKKGYHLKG
jgi:hypothetical protein